MKRTKGGDETSLSDIFIDVWFEHLPGDAFRKLMGTSHRFEKYRDLYWKKKSESFGKDVKAPGNAIIETAYAIKKTQEGGSYGALSYYKRARFYQYITHCLRGSGFRLYHPEAFTDLINVVFPGSAITYDTYEKFKETDTPIATPPICLHKIQNRDPKDKVVILSLGMANAFEQPTLSQEQENWLIGTLEHNLRYLDFYETCMSDKGLLRLIEALSSPLCNLAYLGLQHIYITETAVISALSSALEKPTCPLTTLNLRESICDPGDNGVAQLKTLAKTLREKACPLTSLDLSWNAFGDKGISHLASALKTNCSLTYLNIDIAEENNDVEDPEYNFTDAGATEIALALGSNDTLRKLVLNTTHLSSLGITALVQAAASRDVPICISGIEGFNARVEQERQRRAAEIADAAGSEASAASNTPPEAFGDLCLQDTAPPPRKGARVGRMKQASFNPVGPCFWKPYQGSEAAAADEAPPMSLS